MNSWIEDNHKIKKFSPSDASRSVFAFSIVGDSIGFLSSEEMLKEITQNRKQQFTHLWMLQEVVLPFPEVLYAMTQLVSSLLKKC